MNKVMMLVFGVLTAGSMALTVSDTGVSNPSIDKPSPSVRQGSSRGGFFIGGSSGSRGK